MASVSDTTMAFVEDGELLGARQLDLGNSGLDGQRSEFWPLFGIMHVAIVKYC